MDSENPMPGESTQPADQLDWFVHFDSQTKDLDALTVGKHEQDSSCPDEIQTQIEDLETKISELETQLKTHIRNGGITVDESRVMTDLIEKYSVKLDNIDFMGRTDALTRRRIELIDAILRVQKKLQRLTKVEKRSKNQTGLIVEAREGKLKMNESAVQNLLYLCSESNYTEKYGISLVSIVGDRKSGKSRLFESIQNHAVGREWEVLISPERTLESSGIICSVLCVEEMGKRRLIFLMDIACDESCNSEIYTKLVDFCMLASYIVFYTEKEELNLVDPRNPCYWNVDRSIFTTLPLCVSSNLNRPHIFVLTHKLEYLYLQKTSLLEFRSDRIRERKNEKEASHHSSHSIAVSVSPEGDGRRCSRIPYYSFTATEQLSTTKEAKLYNGNLGNFFQRRQFFERVAANNLDFGAVEGILKQLEQITKTLETECSSSASQWPSSSPHSAKGCTTIFVMGEEDVQLVAKKAVEKYDNYMRCQTGQQIFTDSKIQGLHEHAYLILTSETILSRFEKRQREDYLRLVNDRLRDSRNYFIVQNQTRIMEKIKSRKMLTNEGKMMYSELLCKYPTLDSFNDFVRSARTFAWKLYEKRAKGKNLNVAAWKKAFLSEVDALNQDIFLDNRSKETPQKKISLEDFSKEFQKLELCLRDEDEASLSLVFHLTPSSLQAAVFTPESTQRRDVKSEWNSPVFMDHWPPCILFRSGDTTLIGSDALNSERTSSDSFFNVCDMLLRGTKPRNTVKMNKKEESLEVEEILAMFLFKIKRQIETELNIRLNSAAFAICSLFSTTAKHMVKTSLSLAGFQSSVLLKSKMAALLAETVLAKASNSIYDHMLLLHDGSEIMQICIQRSREGHSLKGRSFNNLMNAKASNSTALMKETIIRNLHEVSHFPTFAIIKPMSPLCQDPSNQTQRLLTTALSELKSSRDSVVRNCEILVQNLEESAILLGAHLYNNPRCDQMKRVKINASKCNVVGEIKKGGVFGFFGAVSVYEFRKDSEFFNQTQRARMVLDVKLRGKDRLRILEKGVGRREVARLTRVDQDDQREVDIQIYVSSEGLLDFQLKFQGPRSEVDGRVQEEVQIVTKYLLPHQVEAAKVKLSKYFKARKLKIEDSWKIFVKNTDSMCTMD